MKFNVTIGNPPYQSGSDSIYPEFIGCGMKNSDIVCMITKDNWLVSPSLHKIRSSMMEQGLKEIRHYTTREDIFEGIRVLVTSFLVKGDYKGEIWYRQFKGEDTVQEYRNALAGWYHIPSSSLELSILQKVQRFKEPYLGLKTVSSMCFGIGTNGKIGNKLIREKEHADELYNLELVYMADKGSTRSTYIKESDIDKNKDLIGQYKVACGEKLNQNRSVISNVKLFGPRQIFTHSYSLMYYTYDRVEAENVCKYLYTKFARYLTLCLVDNMCATNSVRFRLVPEQKFTDNSEIDWSASIEDIDLQLYEKYDVSMEERQYIDSILLSKSFDEACIKA